MNLVKIESTNLISIYQYLYNYNSVVTQHALLVCPLKRFCIVSPALLSSQVEQKHKAAGYIYIEIESR